MNELLEKILATDVLNEETKAEIATAFTQLVNEQVEEIEKFLTLINIYNINNDNPNVREILEKEFKRRLKN